MLSTRVTRLFGIKFPIILPGMSWISEPTLVAAVSNAGGLFETIFSFVCLYLCRKLSVSREPSCRSLSP